jgi:hypothetical protein
MYYNRAAVFYPFALLLFAGGIGESSGPGQQRVTRLNAPTFYIAAKATFDGDPSEIRVEGASNLPPGAVLDVFILPYIGEGGRPISEHTTVVVDTNGFFAASLHPTKGNQFRHNLVCDIVFATRSVPLQPPSVLRVTGSRGEHLGFPENPQTGVMSGENYTLQDLVHVP